MKDLIKYQEALDVIARYISDSKRSITRYSEDAIIEKLSHLKELVDRQDKHEWHDLRKNPKDLPKKDGKYLIYTESLLRFEYNTETFKNYYVREYHSDINKFENIFISDAIVAWKSIEGFGNE